MGRLLEIMGWLGIIGVLAVATFMAMVAQDMRAPIVILPWALPSVIGSALLAGFGMAVQELGDIRRKSERQVELLEEMLRRLQR